jgi:TRAP-type C4-dicarboxylate transport system substrate-binding protein
VKRVLLVSVFIILSFALILSSCAQTSSPSSPEPIKLRFAHPSPPVTVFHKAVFTPWIEMIEERTAAIGKPVDIKVFPAESLAKHADQYNSVTEGIIDICGMITVEDFEPGGGLLSVIELPFLFENATQAAQVAQELYDTIPEFKEEASSEVKLLFFSPTGAGSIHSREKQVKTIADFNNMKMRANRSTSIDIVETLGGVPIDMFIPEIYVSLDRGVLDAVVINWEAMRAFKMYEVTKYRTETPKGIWLDLLSVIMSWDSWNKLPPEVQKIFDETSGASMSKLAGENFDKADVEIRQDVLNIEKEAGKPDWYQVPDDEFQRWVEALDPVNDKWLKRMNDKGLPGEKVLEEARRLAKKYSQ